MRSIVFETSVRFLFPALLLLSLVVLYRGHNLPGGGFIGGLTAAAAFILLSLARGVAVARRRLRLKPESLIATGLAVAGASGLLALATGGTFLQGLWLPSFSLPLLGAVHLGTPLLFDVGVYLAVAGFVLSTVFSLSRVGR